MNQRRTTEELLSINDGLNILRSGSSTFNNDETIKFYRALSRERWELEMYAKPNQSTNKKSVSPNSVGKHGEQRGRFLRNIKGQMRTLNSIDFIENDASRSSVYSSDFNGNITSHGSEYEIFGVLDGGYTGSEEGRTIFESVMEQTMDSLILLKWASRNMWIHGICDATGGHHCKIHPADDNMTDHISDCAHKNELYKFPQESHQSANHGKALGDKYTKSVVFGDECQNPSGVSLAWDSTLKQTLRKTENQRRRRRRLSSEYFKMTRKWSFPSEGFN